MKVLTIVTTITILLIANLATAQLIPATPVKTQIPSIPKIRVLQNGRKLRIYDGNIIQNIQARSLKIRVLDSHNCEGKQLKRQTLSGKKFFTNAIKFDKRTGNLAVGVLLQDCLKQNISAAFILQPEPNWNNYIVHRVSVPGKSLINNRFSTYPLRRIQTIGFIDGNLLIKHTNFDNSEALLVYTSTNRVVGNYAGCVITQTGHSESICPTFN
ncbi:MAG: hypothetical protein AAF316_04755 [Cyanobacteria bacterium P01_A01_bin.80]